MKNYTSTALWLGSPISRIVGHGVIHRLKIVLLLLSLIFFTRISAQEETNYAIHANIIYRFTKYIDWPGYKKSGNFLIGVVGDSPLYDELKKSIAGKMVGYQNIVIKRFSASATSFNCHILFISENERKSIKKIVILTEDAPILLVSESDGLAEKGACINFVIVSDRLRLEINKNNIEQRELSIASELLELGKIIK